MPHPTTLDITASCDWLTLTYKVPRIRTLVHEDASTIIEAWQREGEQVNKWYALGFEGLSCNGLSWGQREDVDMLRLSGSTAEHLFDRFSNYEGKCSRCDVCITLELVSRYTDIAVINYENLRMMKEAMLARSLSLIVNNKGGQTFYLGSRSSDQFGRIYDKGAETGLQEPGKLWRYEVEFKGERSQEVYSRLTRSRDRGTMYLGLVKSFFERRSVLVPGIPASLGVRVEVGAEMKAPDRQLHWLEHQVSGVVRRLREKGYGAEVDAILQKKEG